LLSQGVHRQVRHFQPEGSLQLGAEFRVHHRLQRSVGIVVQELHRIIARGDASGAGPACGKLHLVGGHHPDGLVLVRRSAVGVRRPFASHRGLVHLHQDGRRLPTAVGAEGLITVLHPLLGQLDLLGVNQVRAEVLLVVGRGLARNFSRQGKQKGFLIRVDRLELHRLEGTPAAGHGQSDQDQRRASQSPPHAERRTERGEQFGDFCVEECHGDDSYSNPTGHVQLIAASMALQQFLGHRESAIQLVKGSGDFVRATPQLQLPAQPAIAGDEDNQKNELENETFHGISPFNESLV